MTDSTTEAAMLVHDLPRELAPGTQIEFSAIPIGYSRDPFLVTFDTDKDSIVTKPFGTIAPSWYIGPALGAVRTGRYRHNGTQVQFDLPSDWTVEGTQPSVDNGDIAILKHSPFEGAYAAVWMVREKIRAAGISSGFSMQLPETVAQRMLLQGYKVRPESVRQTWISGYQALTAVADYEENGAKMSASLTWIVTEPLGCCSSLGSRRTTFRFSKPISIRSSMLPSYPSSR